MYALVRAVIASENGGKRYGRHSSVVEITIVLAEDCCSQSRSECGNPVAGFVPSIDSRIMLGSR
jgi:hypothetical protein